MTETTTIQVTTEQRDELADLKTHDDESYKSVIARLLDGVDDESQIDYAEIERRCKRAIGDELEARRR